MNTKKVPEVIKNISRKLRKNQTLSEKVLWNLIRYDKIWYRFLRQRPIYVYTENNWLDRFIIPDFYCHEKKLIIEVDWDIHNVMDVKNLDKYKNKLLNNVWITILRISNSEVENNIENVILKIKQKLN